MSNSQVVESMKEVCSIVEESYWRVDEIGTTIFEEAARFSKGLVEMTAALKKMEEIATAVLYAVERVEQAVGE